MALQYSGIPTLRNDANGRPVAVYPNGMTVPVQDTDPTVRPGEQISYASGTTEGGGRTAPGFTSLSGGIGTSGLPGSPYADGSSGRGTTDERSGNDLTDRTYGGYGANGYSLGLQDLHDAIPTPDYALRGADPTGSGSDHGFGPGLTPPWSGGDGSGGGSVHQSSGIGGGSSAQPGGGGYSNAKARLADAKSQLAGAKYRIKGALQDAGFGNTPSASSTSSGSYGSSSYGSQTQKVAKPKPLHGKYAHGMDESQALGLSLHPTSMLPRVFKGLTPAQPTYTHLGEMPAGAMARLMGGSGNTSRYVNNLGKLYQRAGQENWLPSTGRMLGNLERGKGGIEDMFQGVKAKKGDYPSTLSPGYVYGKEPLPLGEASSQYGSLLDAALYGEPMTVRSKYGSQTGGWGGYLIDKWGSKALNKPAGKGKPIYKSVGRNLFKSG